MRNISVIIVILPLVAALLSLALSKISLHLGRNFILCSVAASLVLSIIQLKKVIEDGSIHYQLGNYRRPIGIEFSIDSVNAVIIVLICVVGLLTVFYSMSFEEGETNKIKIGGAHALTALLIVGMLGMTSTGDVFNLYVFLEITSLSGYVLIALGGSRGVVSAFRYLLVGTVAATAYLLGIAILYASTGTLNMADMKEILSEGGHDGAMMLSICFLVVGFGIKMALFPFHGWQPSAYTHAQTGARPLIAGVMGKIPAYAMFRYMFCIFGSSFIYARRLLTLLGVLAVCGIIYGSIRAMAQTDIRKMLSYSSVAQIGYIALGFAIGTPLALAGAFLHLIGHAFMKGGLFFASGAIRYKYGITDMRELGYVYKKMPATSGLLVIAALSMVGVPPAVGFFSKWYLALGAAEAHDYIYIAVLIISSLLNAIYFFKMIEKIFMADDKHLKKLQKESRFEVPWTMMIAILCTFAAIILLGIFNVRIVDILMSTLGEVGI